MTSSVTRHRTTDTFNTWYRLWTFQICPLSFVPPAALISPGPWSKSSSSSCHPARVSCGNCVGACASSRASSSSPSPLPPPGWPPAGRRPVPPRDEAPAAAPSPRFSYSWSTGTGAGPPAALPLLLGPPGGTPPLSSPQPPSASPLSAAAWHVAGYAGPWAPEGPPSSSVPQGTSHTAPSAEGESCWGSGSTWLPLHLLFSEGRPPASFTGENNPSTAVKKEQKSKVDRGSPVRFYDLVAQDPTTKNQIKSTKAKLIQQERRSWFKVLSRLFESSKWTQSQLQCLSSTRAVYLRADW